MDDALPGPRRAARGTRTPRRRTSVVGVIGEVLITAGVVVLLYVVWQLWVGDLIYGAERNAEGTELSQEWQAQYEDQNPEAAPAPTDAGTDPEVVPVTAPPPVLAEPADGQTFAIMRIPRFGADYAVPMAGGVTRARTLDPIGIGHYPGTKMPGEAGNFALAAHRTTWGKPFNRIADLHVGDAIVVETQAGWYTYRFRTLQYVTPNEVEVLLPVPQQMDVPAGTAYITLTSCSPMYAMTERIVAYGVFESFTPRTASGEEPASLQAVA
ncbi:MULTISPECIES: class E sortase [unclassified Microbacterium]|uniref:class E sortase n=1 Tax=unclassified Microbacterium TaxID=2609290 RepID=UPI000AE355A5|nr:MULTISPECIES: class E sortase [unclassified Microbacterium]MDT0142558.1 class E sortase [Microbacterium sp. PRC9]